MGIDDDGPVIQSSSKVTTNQNLNLLIFNLLVLQILTEGP